MYNKLKQLVKRLLPKRFLFHYEGAFRFVFYQFYRGSQYQCVVCEKGLRQFIRLQNDDQLCPNCGSISRNRRLWSMLTAEFLKGRKSILDFSPSRSLYRTLKSKHIPGYISTDLSGDFIADRAYDITQIDAPNETFDLILCYHVLEHVEKDRQAMKELYRVLQHGGVCLIQTPFQAGATYEDFSITSEEERLKHFGQKDHVRIYSVEGLKERLSQAGFEVEIRLYKEKEDNVYGYSGEEVVLGCLKK
ncbi:MAG: class SAM-dependent methyltransferase [Chitinophagaceae bacterium]|nr:class SAM-dependent methyltransferase [Chitinophagaceae bacterium]